MSATVKKGSTEFSWSGEFSSRPDEELFLRQVWPEESRRIRFTALIGGLLYFMAVIANYYNLRICREFTVILSFRLLVLISGLLTAQLTYRPQRDAYITWAIPTWVTAIGVSELVEMVYMGAGIDYSTPAMIPLVLFYYLFLPNPLVITTVTAVLISLIHIWAVMILIGSPLIHLTTLIIFFTAANGMGFYFVRQTNLLQRREYMTLKKLKAANQARDVFLASMSHELRTPLNAIIGLTELTLNRGPSPGQKENLTTVKESAWHLKEIIDDLLDLAGIQAGKMEMVRIDFNLNRLMEGLARALRIEAEGKGLYLNLDLKSADPVYLKGDPLRLRQVLVNLIGNAIKFTDRGGIEVRAEIGKMDLEDESKTVLFSIEDTGAGIPQEKQGIIFDRFTQADSSTARRYGGIGLGLTISKQLVELMGGRIWLESEAERGSRFYFQIVFKSGDKEAAERKLAEHRLPDIEPSTRPLKVLLAEDNQAGAKMITQFLSMMGHDVETVGSGRQVLELVSKNNFDLVLMDVEMPEMDGIEAARRIRAGETGQEKRNIKIMAVTAHALDALKERAEAAGMDAFLTKPVDINELIAMMNELTLDRRTATPSVLGQVREVQRRLLPELLGTLRDLGRQAADSDARGDFEALRRNGHGIKGAAASFRLYAVSELGRDIEKCGNKNIPLGDRLERLGELLDGLESELAGVDQASLGGEND